MPTSAKGKKPSVPEEDEAVDGEADEDEFVGEGVLRPTDRQSIAYILDHAEAEAALAAVAVEGGGADEAEADDAVDPDILEDLVEYEEQPYRHPRPRPDRAPPIHVQDGRIDWAAYDEYIIDDSLGALCLNVLGPCGVAVLGQLQPFRFASGLTRVLLCVGSPPT